MGGGSPTARERETDLGPLRAISPLIPFLLHSDCCLLIAWGLPVGRWMLAGRAEEVGTPFPHGPGCSVPEDLGLGLRSCPDAPFPAPSSPS